MAVELTTAARALAALERSAVAMSEARIPRVGGRVDATRRAQALVTHASMGADLLAASQVGTSAADAARRASSLLGEVPMTTAGLRSTGAQLRSITAQIRAAEPALPSGEAVAAAEIRARMLDRLGRGGTQLQAEDWRALAAALEQGDDAVAAMPRQLDGLKPMQTIATDLANRAYQPDPGVERYLRAFEIGAMTPDTRIATATRLLEQPATSLTREDWSRLAALVDSPPADAIAMPAQLNGLKPFRQIAREIAAGSYEADAGAQRYLDAWAVDNLAPEQLEQEARSILRLPAAELSREQWSRLGAIVDSGRTSSLGVPRQIDGYTDLPSIARMIAKGTLQPDAVAQRYFDAWRVGSLTREEAVADARQLLAMRAKDLSKEQWGRLGALVESSHAADLGVPTQIAGLKPLRTIAREIAGGLYRPDAGAQRYLDTWAISRMPSADAIAEARAMLTRSATELTKDQWLRLGSLVASRHGDAIGVPRALAGLKDFATITSDIGAGAYRADAGAQRYLTEWARRQNPAYPAQLERALNAVVAGGADESLRTFVAGEWDRLEALVAGRPPDAQAAIAAAMLQSDGVAATRSVRSTLALMQESLRTTPAPMPELEPVRAQTLELVERNLARLERRAPAGANPGYSNHPDYGEIGRIRENMTLLEHARAIQTPAQGSVEAGATLTW